MKNYQEIHTMATMLANGLLSVLKGIPLVKIVRQLWAFLPVCGKVGTTILRRKLDEGIFAALRDAVLNWADCPWNHNIRYVLQRYDLIKAGWMKNACTVAGPSTSDYEVIRMNMERMDRAESDEELEELLQEIGHQVLRKDDSLVEDCVDFMENFLIQWTVHVLTTHLDELKLPAEVQRALELYDLLWNSPVENGLTLISVCHGKFTTVSLEGVNALPAKDRENFLEDELSRLADTLPLRDFTVILSHLLAGVPSENTVLTEWQDSFLVLKA